MAPGAGHGVTLTGAAVAWPADFETVIDNEHPGVRIEGAWTHTTIGAEQLYGGTAHFHAAGAGDNRFNWPAAVPERGRYRLYARWSAHSNRATDATYRVRHDGGVTPVVVNQQVNSGAWVSLGTYELASGAGHKVVLSDDADGT